MAINENWNIRSRAHVCSHTTQPFKDGDSFMTVLMEDAKTGELVRRDFSLPAWAEVEPTLGQSFSVWRSVYEAVKSEGRPEITEKESAEALLRRLIEEDSIMTENTRYILAVMLERKKQLRQTGTRETEEETFLIYEHPKSGEVYIVRDPELKLAQIEEVQQEVSRLLSGENEAKPRTVVSAPEVPEAVETMEAVEVASIGTATGEANAVDQHVGGDSAVLEALPELVSDVGSIPAAGD